MLFRSPELVVPASIVDLTPEFAHRRGSYWRVDAETIPWTRDGYLQVQVSINARMALIRAQEKKSRALLAAAQQNLISALQLQCANAEDLELVRLENCLLKRMFDHFSSRSNVPCLTLVDFLMVFPCNLAKFL